MVKRSSDSTGNWLIFDNKRSDFNLVDDFLIANTNAAETTSHASINLDFLSNGFKLRGNNVAYNGSGATFIYMAFASSPFVSSEGVPTTAR
jgi:hypothetical protein